MNIVVIGNDAALQECKNRLGSAHQYLHALIAKSGVDMIAKADVVFDFSEEHSRESLDVYKIVENPTVFLNTVFTTLSGILNGKNIETPIIGFCGLPTFFNREVLEVSITDERHREKLNLICQALGLKYIAVKDQVGFVTPRVVCMIINEAYDALKNGVASRGDIDLSMKLGTNYPFGPFEWSERIGVDNVRKLLSVVESATGDVRYRPMF